MYFTNVSNTKLEVFVKIIVFQSTVVKKLEWAVLISCEGE